MKSLLTAASFILCAALTLPSAGWAAGRDGGGQRGGGGRSGGQPQRSAPAQRAQRPSRPSVVIHMRRYSVPKPQRISNPREIVNDGNHVAAPQRDERGSAITQTRALQPPRQHATVARNPGFVRDIQRQQRTEKVAGRYYWHTSGNLHYAHYLDAHGNHWYGFYHGAQFYWTRYYSNRWWWYDTRFARWDYWWDGYWWWPGPQDVVYAYVDNNYYPYEDDDSAVTVQEPEAAAPPVQTPAPNLYGADSSRSPDGTRMVQIFGPRSEAFLYDTTQETPAFLKYLGSQAQTVRYSGGTNGAPLRILIDFKDNSFALFDADGHPMDDPSAADPADLPKPSTPPGLPESVNPGDVPQSAPPGAPSIPPTPPPGQGQ